MLDTTSIEQEQKALNLLAQEVQKATDAEERALLMDEIQKTANRLEQLCRDLQAEADTLAPKREENGALEAVVEVVLTPEQRSRVLAATGIDVPSVRIKDPTADLTKNMGHVQPEFIEECALEQAQRFKELMAEADEATEEAAHLGAAKDIGEE